MASSTATASSMDLAGVCVGCGNDLSTSAKTVKELGEDSTISHQETRVNLLSTWRELAAESSLLQHCSQLDESLLRMCNSCYNDYAKFNKLKTSIANNIEAAGKKLKNLDLAAATRV